MISMLYAVVCDSVYFFERWTRLMNDYDDNDADSGRLMKAATTSNECLNQLGTIHNLLTITFAMHALNSMFYPFSMSIWMCFVFVYLMFAFGLAFTLRFFILLPSHCLCIEHLFYQQHTISSCNSQYLLI